MYIIVMTTKESAADCVKMIEGMVDDSSVLIIKSSDALVRRAIINSCALLPIISGVDMIVMNIKDSGSAVAYSKGTYDLSKAKVVVI